MTRGIEVFSRTFISKFGQFQTTYRST
uniref:Uncharacterized protein n=1 Tax=Rhizophora mucronata TaxID=61149 RepID=A0A2P2P349_RHIMU